MRARGAAGWYAFAVEGLSLEKLLNRCAQEGIRLRRVCRCGAKRATGSVRAADWAALSALCERMGFRLTQGEASGPVRLAGLFRRRALLVTGVLAFLVLLWGLTSCLWFVRVTGAGPYAGEVARILQAHEIRPGRLRYTLDVAALQRDLHSQLTGLAWVGVEVSGVYLTVSCVQAEPRTKRRPTDRQTWWPRGTASSGRCGSMRARRWYRRATWCAKARCWCAGKSARLTAPSRRCGPPERWKRAYGTRRGHGIRDAAANGGDRARTGGPHALHAFFSDCV